MKHYLPLIGRAVSAGLSVAALLFIAQPAAAQDVAALNAKLPKAVRDRGVLMVGNSASVSPPWSYHPDNDSEKYAGFDVDLATEIARRLGLKVKFESLPFASLIPGIVAGRFDMGMQGMADNPARQKVVDMVDYMFSGDGIIVQAGNPKNINALADLCGKKGAALLGSSQLALLQEQSEKCDKPIEIMQFPQIADAYVALQSGRADAYVYGYEISSYLEKTNSPQFKGLKLIPTILNVGVKAIAVQKGFPELRDLIKTIIGDMIADGSYQKMADKWGLADNTVKAPAINDHLMKP